MSTTNPGEHPGDPVGGLSPAAPGQPKADDHDVSGPPDPATIARGYEEDGYDKKSVISVPLLVIAFFVIAFVTTTILFAIFAPSSEDPNAHPQAVKRNSPDLNTRIARTKRGGEIDQPRPEPIKERAGFSDNRATTSPEKPGVNSPEYHPEDLVPSVENTPALFRTGWVKPGIARITIDEAMDAMLTGNQLPVQKVQSLPIASEHLPTAANAGRGAGENTVTQPRPPEPEGKK